MAHPHTTAVIHTHMAQNRLKVMIQSSSDPNCKQESIRDMPATFSHQLCEYLRHWYFEGAPPASDLRYAETGSLHQLGRNRAILQTCRSESWK